MANAKSALAPAGAGRPLGRSKWRRLRENYPFLIMVFPAVLVVFLFNYLPIYGVLIAFQDFMPGDKIFSPYTRWVSFDNFKRFFTDVQFWPLMKNTFLLCIYGLAVLRPLRAGEQHRRRPGRRANELLFGEQGLPAHVHPLQ